MPGKQISTPCGTFSRDDCHFGGAAVTSEGALRPVALSFSVRIVALVTPNCLNIRESGLPQSLMPLAQQQVAVFQPASVYVPALQIEEMPGNPRHVTKVMRTTLEQRIVVPKRHRPERTIGRHVDNSRPKEPG